MNRAWALPFTEVLGGLGVGAEEGLTPAEAGAGLETHGPNRLREVKKRSVWLILAGQFKSLIVALLAAAAVLSFAFGEILEGWAILAVILINAAIGFYTELRAMRSMEALYRLGTMSTKVRRGGEVVEVAAERLVPGDIVILEGGDIVTADLRLVTASKLQADESALTGESMPVGKTTDELDEATPLAERANMLYKGTFLTRGSGEAVVVATGMETELGRISSLVEEAEREATPLEKRLNRLGHRLIWATLAVAAAIAGTGMLTGKEVFLMVETSIALAVAAIPEGLPIVATIALARGMLRMAQKNALIKRLSAVETLGATNVIYTDKTGTLTENRMTVTRIVLSSGGVEVGAGGDGRGGSFRRSGEILDPGKDDLLRKALTVAVLCNNAALGAGGGGVGDPLEVALLEAASKAGVLRERLAAGMPEVREEAFDSDIKMMATFNEDRGRYGVSVKGAPEPVLAACTSVETEGGGREMERGDREMWFALNEEMAGEGLRVLALAAKTIGDIHSNPYEGLGFIGLVGMLDPPRGEVRGVLDTCRGAGIRVVMVTGDQAVTARNVGLAVGLIREESADVVSGGELEDIGSLSEPERLRLLEARIFARVSPKQKLDLIALRQESGAVVAMTGDGVNDAPALKKADIGVAMGLRGTQVAREAAHMILKDDSLSTIVTAVEQGRVIFDNIRKCILYLLSCNISEIMCVAAASLVNAPLPILPLQILFLNLITDVFPALALSVGEGDPGVMKRPARDPREPLLARRHWFAVAWYGLAITVSVLGAFALAIFRLEMDPAHAVTVSFLTLAFAQLWHVFNMRERGTGFLRNEISRNVFVWAALLLCCALLFAAVYVPGLALVLKLADPGLRGWLVVLGMSLIPFLAGQLSKPNRP